MGTRIQLIGLVGLGAGVVSWLAGLGLALAVLLGLVVTALLLVMLTRPSVARGREPERDVTIDRWGSPAMNALLWGGLLFGWANGTGGAEGADHPDGGASDTGPDGGGGFDAGGFDAGGFDAGGGSDGGSGGFD